MRRGKGSCPSEPGETRGRRTFAFVTGRNSFYVNFPRNCGHPRDHREVTRARPESRTNYVRIISAVFGAHAYANIGRVGDAIRGRILFVGSSFGVRRRVDMATRAVLSSNLTNRHERASRPSAVGADLTE